MQLSVWTYEGPPHVGAMRIAPALTDVHYVLHAPQGDTYADLLFTMIERMDRRPPVTYTTFQARDLGGDTATLFKEAVRDAHARFRPTALMVGASCTAELIQDDPGGLARAVGLDVPVIPLELPSYQRRENWGAAETFYAVVRSAVAQGAKGANEQGAKGANEHGAKGATGLLRAPSALAMTCNILGPTALGFRHRDDVIEVRRLLEAIGVSVNVVAPLGASYADLQRLPEADFNVVLYPEIAQTAAEWLKRQFKMPFTTTVPIGVGATKDFVREVATLAGLEADAAVATIQSRLGWYSRSVDSTYLTGKRVFIFGDATHALAAARIASEELGFTVVGLGTYTRERAREVRAAAAALGLEALIGDDYLAVEQAIRDSAPELVLGTQMERHIAKRLGVAAAVISAPVHVQDFPARYSPQMGPEGANVIFDSWVHPLMMGLEEHLLGMFSEDTEFGERGSHLGAVRRTEEPGAEKPRAEGPKAEEPGAEEPGAERTRAEGVKAEGNSGRPAWSGEAELELKKIPFFVRGKARKNTEAFATARAIEEITLETLYEAKAFHGK